MDYDYSKNCNRLRLTITITSCLHSTETDVALFPHGFCVIYGFCQQSLM